MSTAFAHLSRPQATVLALWSYGMVLARSCGLTVVAATLAVQLDCSEASLVHRLREWWYAAHDKHGTHRRELEVSTCFAPFLRWILSCWPADEPRLAVALDATSLKNRLSVLTMSVLSRGCALPVAWKVVGAEEQGTWCPLGWDCSTGVQGSLPGHWKGLVLRDRGRSAPWRSTHIRSLGWHPFMRINQPGNVRPVGESAFRSLATAAPSAGRSWCGRVDCFSQAQSRWPCPVVARWEAGSQEVWLIVTDLEPAQAAVAWDGRSSWIEAGLKATKRGGGHGQQTKLVDPARAERVW